MKNELVSGSNCTGILLVPAYWMEQKYPINIFIWTVPDFNIRATLDTVVTCIEVNSPRILSNTFINEITIYILKSVQATPQVYPVVTLYSEFLLHRTTIILKIRSTALNIELNIAHYVRTNLLCFQSFIFLWLRIKVVISN